MRQNKGSFENKQGNLKYLYYPMRLIHRSAREYCHKKCEYIYAPLTREKTVYEKGCKGNMEISVGGRFSAFNKSYD
jgi:hypothetical protein